MIRCQEGHLYDPSKHTGCPWCGSASPFADIVAGPPGKTVALRPSSASAPPPPPSGDNAPQNQASGSMSSSQAAPVRQHHAVSHPAATVRLVEKQTGINPVVGWLVCTSGPMRGQDFPLYGEKNFIGRDRSMQVCLSADNSVSRERHAAVVFDPKKHMFWLSPGDASGLVYLNGELVNAPLPLNERDAIEVGSTALVFVTFVNDQFRWES